MAMAENRSCDEVYFYFSLNQKHLKTFDGLDLIMNHNLQPCFRGHLFIVCFVALRPKSTAMVIAGRSVHLTTLFPGQA